MSSSQLYKVCKANQREYYDKIVTGLGKKKKHNSNRTDSQHENRMQRDYEGI